MKRLLKTIEKADAAQLHQIMDAIAQQYRQRFPDWSVIYLAIPAIDPERNEEFHADVQALLKKYQ